MSVCGKVKRKIPTERAQHADVDLLVGGMKIIRTLRKQRNLPLPLLLLLPLLLRLLLLVLLGSKFKWLCHLDLTVQLYIFSPPIQSTESSAASFPVVYRPASRR